MAIPLSLLPPLGTTGIGSLPHTQLELGLQRALQVDIPYLPQLPVGTPSELMIPSVLEGLPGLSYDEEGTVEIDLPAWREGRDAFGARLERSLETGELTWLEPSPTACRALRPFLWELGNRRLALAKAQLAGPLTVRWVARTTGGAPASEVAELDQQLYRLVFARGLALCRAIRRAGATPILYLDEPGLYALDVRDPRHLLALQELRLLVVALRKEGAVVGLHCCSNTDWPRLMELGLDLLAIDVRLSLDAVLEDREAFGRYIASGGGLGLGIIPTNTGAEYRLGDLIGSVEASLRASVGDLGMRQVLSRSLLAPACGLAMRTVLDAERVFEELREAQVALRGLLGAEPPEPPGPGS